MSRISRNYQDCSSDSDSDSVSNALQHTDISEKFSSDDDESIPECYSKQSSVKDLTSTLMSLSNKLKHLLGKNAPSYDKYDDYSDYSDCEDEDDDEDDNTSINDNNFFEKMHDMQKKLRFLGKNYNVDSDSDSDSDSNSDSDSDSDSDSSCADNYSSGDSDCTDTTEDLIDMTRDDFDDSSDSNSYSDSDSSR